METLIGIVVLVLFVMLVSYIIGQLASEVSSRFDGGRSEKAVHAYLAGHPGSKAVAIYQGQGVLGVDTERRTVTLATKGGERTFHASKIVDVRQSNDTHTTYTTRGRSAGTPIAGMYVSGNRSQTTAQTRTIGSYVVLTLDDYDCPTLAVPMRKTSDAEQWAGMVRVMVSRWQRENAVFGPTSETVA